MAKSKIKAAPFPSKQELLDFIRESPVPVGRKEIARAFRIRGPDRVALKALIKELEDEGQLDRHGKRGLTRSGGLPEVLVVEITGRDSDGELLAKPAAWRREGAPPKIYMAPERRGRPALGSGDRVLARLRRIEGEAYEGRTIRVLGGVPRRVLGIYERGERGGRLRPTDRRAKNDFVLRGEDAGGARPGELVLAELKPHHPRLGMREVVVLERLGHLGDLRALSLISIHEHDLPTVFSPEALAEAEAAGPAQLGRREDLRDLPLVTIDGADARDFDDAVWAAPDDDPKNPGGWQLVVAIADVAHYVRPDSALDRNAYERGNSVYFPDRVVPMLPEALSNGWCSLRPGEERPCLAARIWLDREGRIKRHRFVRGLKRSAARLTYEQVQAARDGRPDKPTKPLLDPVIGPLYGAFEALATARDRRGRQGRRDRAAAEARQPPADRGVHDRRQRGRGRDARSPATALHVPRARRPGPAKAGGAQGGPLVLRLRPGARPGDQTARLRPDSRESRGHTLCANGQRAGSPCTKPGSLCT